MQPVISGILTGMFLQLAIGPVFMYVLGITIDSNYIISLSGIIAVTLVDFIYIIISIVGIGKILENELIKKTFGILSSFVLILFGVTILFGSFNPITNLSTGYTWTIKKAFISCFVLTITSPLTIVYWTGIFTAKAIEKNYSKKELIFFGIGAGLSTFIFMSITMYAVSLIRGIIPKEIISFFNFIVGIVLISYGMIRSIKIMKMHLTKTSI
ncbi:MAG: hypothetical protein A2015_04185 [Spirochaetes bacterium GWF1_31_7]|nr:MAG: hypothetical protein A2Y30_17085 [Spirochaetes bacterium GWE1_32_154]OHD47411.1 MAG: hypothetical protein A2Y29_10095 [Spirochaetes bacterium GWE2_31_10]OHD52922.1 MAG: hypothetical protein A2015_04185 [Spirochaetes bacterium GWF1_31_7]OHD79841.1 MAG: hypothetical protein A2355_11710 [Spirochaetes bacterium RIFOXYB1_FULL_32_8]